MSDFFEVSESGNSCPGLFLCNGYETSSVLSNKCVLYIQRFT